MLNVELGLRLWTIELAFPSAAELCFRRRFGGFAIRRASVIAPFALQEVFGSDAYLRTDVEELYHLLCSLHVEIEEELVFLLVEGADVVLIILEEGALAIGGEKRIPVDVTPVGVVGDADVLHRQGDVVIGGDGERERTVGGRDDHTVAIGLLDKALVALYQAFIVAVQLLIPLDGTEICGGKKGFQFTLNFEI